MESHKIETLLEKYFEGETSIAEENLLQQYFSSSNVAPQFEQYKGMFGYFSKAREQQFEQVVPLEPRKRKVVSWLSIAASIVVLLGVGTFAYNTMQTEIPKDELGTFNDPETAFRETQKALDMLASHVNTGVESVEYIGEYEQQKNNVFKN